MKDIKAKCIMNINDLVLSDDYVMDFMKRFYIQYHNNKNTNLLLYQIGTCSHLNYTNLTVSPHFLRNDGVVIYLQRVQNNIYSQKIQIEIIHLAMEITQCNKSILVTFEIKNNVDFHNIAHVAKETHFNLDIATNNFNLVEKHIEYNANILEKYLCSNTSKNKENIEIFDKNKWVSASKTRNYALRDTLTDWLDNWHEKKNICINNSIRNKKSNNLLQTSNNFTGFVMKKGVKFEANVMKLIRKKIELDKFVIICANMYNYNIRIFEYEKRTIEEIKKGTPVIYQPVLMNRSGNLSKTYGSPDLLIRSDYIHKIVEKNPLSAKMSTYKAPLLNGNYHYILVDIKFSTLELCADGERIRNYGSIPAYKCQMYIYNHALGQIQGYEPPRSYILGRRYKFTYKNTTYCENNCFTRLGHIQYNDWDKKYIQETIDATNWIKKMRLHGEHWELYPKPSVTELYPNMTTSNESRWNEFKNKYARDINEITLLWNCGIKNREIAHKNGVYSYMDQKCNSSTVGVKGSMKAPILNEIIRINQKIVFSDNMDRIYLKLNNNVNNKWLNSTNLRITVDFEIINSVFDDFENLPIAQDRNYLFMIGLAYQITANNTNNISQTIYKMFLVSELSIEAEFQLVYQFHSFLRDLTDTHLGKHYAIPDLYHWGHVEKSFFDGLCIRLLNNIGTDIEKDINTIKSSLKWCDMSECFKKNPIVINGCFKFGLKEIAGRLSELGLIQSRWNINSQCSSGGAAMILAQKAYTLSKKLNQPVINDPIVSDIMEYNKIDCIVIHDIIDLLIKKNQSIESNNKRKTINIIPNNKKRKIMKN